jgi:prevent-host-death family protein
MATETLPITAARKELLELVDKVDHTLARYIITKNGVPKAMLMSFEEFEGWLEALDILDDPDWVKALNQAKREVKKGKLLSFEEVVGRKQASVRS